MAKKSYEWSFSTVGGETRVNITKGSDIAHLCELDQKMWTVLSCPVKGLEFDEKTLSYMDSDLDGKIRVNEIIEVSEWLKKVLADMDLLLNPQEDFSLSNFNQQTEEGKQLYASAKQILENLEIEKESISLANTADSLAIFAKTRFNGDGVITVQSTDDDKLKKVIEGCMQCVGTKTDRSGAEGVTADNLTAFYTLCQEYLAWKKEGEDNKESVFPFGDETAEAYSLFEKLKSKIEDFYLRCKFVAFDEDATAALDVSVARLETMGEKNLTTCLEDIGNYPLARVNKEALIPLDGGVNPVWEADFTRFKEIVISALFANNTTLSEGEWKQIAAKMGAYASWIAAQKGEVVAALESDVVNAAVDASVQEQLSQLVAADTALEAEANSIESVDKLLHYYRDFYKLLKNYVTFSDFYTRDPNKKAVFQAGTLFIDQRSCDLCVRVSDMGKQNVMAPLSGMFLMYCECRSKLKNETMTIVAVMTDGDVNDLRVGKNAVFYDRNGLDWDATIVKIIDNPISIRQAFWSPYHKFGRFCTEQINKFAAEKDNKVSGDMTASATNATSKISEGKPEKPAGKTPFDIAKFAGIFAAIGLALGYIGGFLVACFKGFVSLKLWQMVLVLIGLMLLISGPSMLMAWMKLRKRDLAPVLNANGWAVNARILVNILFGASLTQIVKFPTVSTTNDPFVKKGLSFGQKILVTLIVLLLIAAAIAVLYFTNCLAFIGFVR